MNRVWQRKILVFLIVMIGFYLLFFGWYFSPDRIKTSFFQLRCPMQAQPSTYPYHIIFNDIWDGSYSASVQHIFDIFPAETASVPITNQYVIQYEPTRSCYHSQRKTTHVWKKKIINAGWGRVVIPSSVKTYLEQRHLWGYTSLGISTHRDSAEQEKSGLSENDPTCKSRIWKTIFVES